ncbi:endothelin-converting enzyme homolog [Leptidea sinapis]|uniref:endothelin-converting enzyme homolog n=1 Tax=Leptidea sinapis TaxID=189913 RepID=UPI0021C2EF75|nr:endothelin-converting enzyme homolog [Leptidea sinapis]
MNAWRVDNDDGMGPSVTRAASAKPSTPPLKNGNDLHESGYLISVGSRTARFRRKHKNKMIFIILLIVLLLLVCLFIAMSVLYIKQKRYKSVRICESKECLRSAANLALSLDSSVDPCDDFYQYVCGNWAEEHPRPDSYQSYDWFRDKQTKLYTVVRDFLKKNTTHCPKPVQQAKDMYSACIDTETLDKRGLKPVSKVLEHLQLPPYPTFTNITDVNYLDYSFDWIEAVIKIKTHLGMDVLIGFDIFTDPKNSSVYRLVMGSPETTNPFPSSHNKNKRNRVRYFHHNNNASPIKIARHKSKKGDEDKEAEIYKLFYARILKLFVLDSGVMRNSSLSESVLDQNLLQAADTFYTMETDMYELETFNETDIHDNEHLIIPEYKIDLVQKYTDAIVESNNGTAVPIWKRYLDGVFNISEVRLDYDIDKVLISDPDLKYLSLLAAYLSKVSPVVTELYIWIKVVEVMAVHTTTELRELYQKSSAELSAHRLTSSRSLHCANAVNDMLGMAVAYAIADQNFFNVTKPKIETMLHELKNALAHLVGTSKWMDDDTKLATYKKIVQMKTLVGFPNWLLENGKLEEYYQGIEIDTGYHLENMINIIQVKIRKSLNKFRMENNYTWATDPTEVNAYHTYQENTITVPLVMLQHPFFDLGLDSLNYGSLGAVLGHEITHGFDNFGGW